MTITTFFYNIYRFIRNYKYLSLLFFIVLVVGLGYTASRLRFVEDITQLIPTNTKTEELTKILQSVNFSDKIILTISQDSSGSKKDLTAYATKFITKVDSCCTPFVKNIQGKLESDDLRDALTFVYDNLPLFLTEEDYHRIQNKLNQDSITSVTAKNYKSIISPSGIISKNFIRKDPLGISFIALKKLKKIGVDNNFTVEDGFLFSKDKQRIMLFISPRYKANKTAENDNFVTQLLELQQQLNNEFSGKAKSRYFGAPIIAVENARQIKTDIAFTVGVALGVLLLVLILFYRKIYVPFILFLPSVFGALVAICVLYSIRSEVSAISLGIGSVILGITIDYALHILTHLKHSRNKQLFFEEITVPVLMSSLTTACAFLCLLFLDAQALQDLGVFASVSVLCSSFFALIFIPQLYHYQSRRNAHYKVNKLQNLVTYPLHKNKWVLIGIFGIMIVSFFTYQNVGFTKDLNSLNYESKPIKQAKKELEEASDMLSKSVYVVSYAPTENEALAYSDTLYNWLKHLEKTQKINGVSSISALVNAESKQEERIKRWQKFWSDSLRATTKNNLIEAGKQYGFKPETYADFYALTTKDFAALNPADFSEIPGLTIDDYLQSSPNRTTITSLVKLSESTDYQLQDDISNLNNTLVIDRKQLNETFLGQLKTDFQHLINYSLAVVLLLLLLFYKNVRLTLITALPVFITWFITLGLMGVIGVQFTIFNIIISTFIFGLGIDYSIFMTNALLVELRTGKAVLPTYKTAILLSVLTTLLGVGVLVFAKHPALFSISSVSLIGIFTVILITFSLQPLLFNFFIGSKTSPPVSFRMFFNSVFSFAYYGFGCILLSVFSVAFLKYFPLHQNKKKNWFYTFISKFVTSVLYSNPFVKKRIFSNKQVNFDKSGILIANHTSFLDTLVLFMTYPKIIFFVNDWVYNSLIFGKAVRAAGFFPVSEGIENAFEHLEEKLAKGYVIGIFPEGSRSRTNKLKRFHKGAFLLAKRLELPIIPVIIHGNAEVLPKGNFVIRDGSISVKILDEIFPNHPLFEGNTREQTKKISTYYKAEYLKFRRAIEHKTYFHALVKNEYQYKGNSIYKEVKKDLKTHVDCYYKLLQIIPLDAKIVHISNAYGQLDFLLSLDSIDRTITTFIPDAAIQTMVSESYLTNTRKKNIAVGDFESISAINHTLLLINMKDFTFHEVKHLLSHNISVIIAYGVENNQSAIKLSGYHQTAYYKNENIRTYQRDK